MRLTLDQVTCVAFAVRRYQLLASPVLASTTLAELPERVKRLHEDGRDPLVLTSLAGAEPVDLVAGRAVMLLSKSRRGADPLLEALAMGLEDERKAALYFALPEGAPRRYVERHPCYARAIQPYRTTIDEALFDLDHLFEAMLDGAREAIETGDPASFTRYIPARFRFLIPAELRIREAS